MPVARTLAPVNLVVLMGELSRPPQFRILKDGLTVTTFDIKVAGEQRPETLRVSWFDAPASALEHAEGDSLAVVGRVRRFWYSGRQSITDVVAHRVMPARSVARVRRALGEAMAELQEASP